MYAAMHFMWDQILLLMYMYVKWCVQNQGVTQQQSSQKFSLSMAMILLCLYNLLLYIHHMCTNVYVYTCMWLCWRANCCNEAFMYRWVSEGKPEEVREVEQSLFSLTSYVVMFLYHITCRRAGVHVQYYYKSQMVSPEVRSKRYFI